MFSLSFLNKTVLWLSEQYNLFTDIYKIGKAGRVAALQCAALFASLKRADLWAINSDFSLVQAD
jgi:hypothetical protein